MFSFVIITLKKKLRTFSLHFSVATSGRRPNGLAFTDERFVYPGHSYDSLDDSPLPLTSPRVFSPQDAASMKYYSMSNDAYYRNHMQKLHRSKSKKHGSFMYNNGSQPSGSNSQRMPVSEKRNGVRMINHDLPGHRQYAPDCPQKHGVEQLDGSDCVPQQLDEEFRLREAQNASLRVRNTAKFKRHRANNLHSMAEVAIHRAMVALMTADAIKASNEVVGGGSKTNS